MLLFCIQGASRTGTASNRVDASTATKGARRHRPIRGPAASVLSDEPKAELFYKFIPGLNNWEEDIEANFWHWMLHTSDEPRLASVGVRWLGRSLRCHHGRSTTH